MGTSRYQDHWSRYYTLNTKPRFCSRTRCSVYGSYRIRYGFTYFDYPKLVGAVLGVGLARGVSALNLGIVRNIVVSWIVTLPAGAILSIIFFYILKASFGVA